MNWTVLLACAHTWRSFLSYLDCLCDCACICMCRGLFRVCMFVWPCGWQDVAELCFVMITHGGIKPQAARWSLSVWGPLWLFLDRTAETLTSHNTSFRKQLKLKIRYYLTGITEWSVKSASLSPFGTFPLKWGQGFPSEKTMLWQRD